MDYSELRIMDYSESIECVNFSQKKKIKNWMCKLEVDSLWIVVIVCVGSLDVYCIINKETINKCYLNGMVTE